MIKRRYQVANNATTTPEYFDNTTVHFVKIVVSITKIIKVTFRFIIFLNNKSLNMRVYTAIERVVEIVDFTAVG